MADITAGLTFVDDDTYAAGDLNTLVGNAVINPALITGKSAVAPATTDNVLISDTSNSGALIKNTIAVVLDLQLKDAAAGTASMRTLGTGGQQAAQGNLVPYLVGGNDIAGINSFSGVSLSVKHLISAATGSGITIAPNTGAGSTGTASLLAGSTDMSGIIILTPSGTGITANTVQCTITFGGTYTTAPQVLIAPFDQSTTDNQATAGKGVTATPSATAFTLKSGASTALTTGVAMKFVYMVHGH